MEILAETLLFHELRHPSLGGTHPKHNKINSVEAAKHEDVTFVLCRRTVLSDIDTCAESRTSSHIPLKAILRTLKRSNKRRKNQSKNPIRCRSFA